jgi:hypothetical protein
MRDLEHPTFPLGPGDFKQKSDGFDPKTAQNRSKTGQKWPVFLAKKCILTASMLLIPCHLIVYMGL